VSVIFLFMGFDFPLYQVESVRAEMSADLDEKKGQIKILQQTLQVKRTWGHEYFILIFGGEFGVVKNEHFLILVRSRINSGRRTKKNKCCS